MASFNDSATSSSSKPTRGCTFDVFLSFRGEDTRYSFVDHLYAALVQKGIRVFKDDVMIRKGKFISEELTHAIEESRFAVVVFSKNYADSSWCLGELVKIMKCQDQMGLMVLPVFYHVEPSDVRKQKGDYAAAFQKHEDNISGEKNEVSEWREALAGAANLSGYHISAVSGGESLFIRKIVQEVMGNKQPRAKQDNLIGIEYHMNVLNRLLSMQKTKETRVIGIHGMGGIGKTTIAHALFGRISFRFEGSSFIKNVREQSSNERDICTLQKRILTDVLGAHLKFEIQDPEDGANIIQETLHSKKVLLVLDDVDDVKELEFLAASNDWFGAGSRIVITTRDEHVLSDANARYKPDLLSMDQAVELFSRHAFRKNSPPEEYKELAERAVRYTGGLPLALKVIGCYFRGRKAGVWESALDKLAKIPNGEVFEKLKLSFDNLDDSQKKALLDIAFFFKGYSVGFVTRMLDSFEFYAKINISVLVEKSLITIEKKFLYISKHEVEEVHMHDLIRDMCLQIVRESFTNSRFRNLEEVHEMVVKKEVREVIEAIVVRNKRDLCFRFRSDIFESMNNLRLLDVVDKFTSDEPSFLPKSLRWIRWWRYPYSSLPVPHASKLVGLEMEFSMIQHLWEGQKIMPNLKFIHLKYSNCLTSFPDVSEAPNIEILRLNHCDNLVEVHDSVGFLKKLVYLEISDCKKLKLLPSRIETESLDFLVLQGCKSLERISEFSPCAVKLSSLDLSECSELQGLPSSIRYLSNLSFLNMNACKSLKSIPSCICELKRLKCMSLFSCSKLQKLPDQLGSMPNLENLDLGFVESFNFRDLTNPRYLRDLRLRGNQLSEEDFGNLDGFSSLEVLCLDYNKKLARLPATISHLSNLKRLSMDFCFGIQSLHSLPSGLQVLSAVFCSSLEKIEDLSKECEFLNNIRIFGCYKLLEDEQSRSYLDNMLKELFLKKWAAVDRRLSITIPGNKIPSWFKEQQHGNQISLKLSPKWQTEILGFAICCILRSHGYVSPSFIFRFENSGKLIPKSEAHNFTQYATAGDENMFIQYVPFTSFEHMINYNDFQLEDWSHMAEDNLVIDILRGNLSRVLGCGVHVVYKEDVESIQQIKPPVSSNYWDWSLVQGSSKSIQCSEISHW